MGPNWAVLKLPPRQLSGPIQREMQGNLIFVPALWGPWQDSSYKPWFRPCCSLHPLCRPLGATTHPSHWACRASGGLTPSRGAPALHHPAADGFSQVLGAHLISPRPCVFPVTFLHLFMLIKATSEATGYLLCCIAELHTHPLPPQPHCKEQRPAVPPGVQDVAPGLSEL